MGYLIAGWLGKDAKTLRDLYRCCYGAACFGILFSFVGTVLGGLWADDSWGRFWGWDPKENGALLIVIWNALMLHARWDGMVAARGFAIARDRRQRRHRVELVRNQRTGHRAAQLRFHFRRADVADHLCCFPAVDRCP